MKQQIGYATLGLALLGVALAGCENASQSQRMAKLTPAGTMTTAEGKDVVGDPQIAKALEGAVIVVREGKQWDWKCDDKSLAQYAAVAQQSPNFPFSHFILAECQKKTNNPAWTTHAKHANDLLAQTTKVAGHHPSHDAALKAVEAWLKDVK